MAVSYTSPSVPLSPSSPCAPSPTELTGFSIHVAILDDHPIICAHLEGLLAHHADLLVKRVAHRTGDTLPWLDEGDCDLLLLDFYLPDDQWDGAALIKRIRRQHPHLIIVVLSGGRPRDTCYAAFRAGANGYISKKEIADHIPDLLRKASYSPDWFFYVDCGRIHTGAPPAPFDALTQAEVEIMRMIANGMSVGELAKKLVRSKKTVSAHKRRAMRKLGLADDVALARYLQRIHGSII